ncbi:LCP family protein [Liquorilactobacillus oeni]|uniref:LytR family transcriptional regulator n=1 Tax=Liquorilactobacillus oeni DSM 19972 TaxID=1423777 RepID=A0A0R1M9P7_9LACO|nr:LCP family protein [Liquorilactobacillus oeni]KRL04896.1 LytR family transcriptional regulator [Liquorilactobacillus oeni DSM 19972]
MNKNEKEKRDFLETPLRRSSKNSHRKINIHSKRKKICAIALLLVLVIFYGAGLYAHGLLGDAKKTLDKTYQKTNVKKLRNVSQVLKEKKPFSVLLLGTDTGDLGRSDKGRTDTIIVATINPDTKRATLTSIPRDTQVKVSGDSSSYEKINSAYTNGGTAAAVKTVQNTLHVPLDFYLLVNMGGLRKLVDAVDGVTITPLLTFKYSAADVTKGKTVTLNGKQALAYSRMRYTDPEGDYGRQKRQKQVIKAIVNKLLSVKSLSNYQKILDTVEDNMQTDLTYDDMITVETNYKDAANSIKSYVLKGDDAMINGLSYQIASAEEKKKVSNRIRNELGLDPSTENFVGQLGGTTYSNSTGSGYGTYSGNSSTEYGSGTASTYTTDGYTNNNY